MYSTKFICDGCGRKAPCMLESIQCVESYPILSMMLCPFGDSHVNWRKDTSQNSLISDEARATAANTDRLPCRQSLEKINDGEDT